MQIKKCEIGSNILLSNDPGWIRDKVYENQLVISGVYEFGHFGVWSQRRSIYLHHDKLSKLLRYLDINFVILCSGFLFKNHTDSKEKMLEMMREIVKRYTNIGIHVGIHPHKATSIFTSEDIDLVLEYEKENISLVPDLSHLKAANLNLYKFYEKYYDVITEFHIKGMKKIHDQHYQINQEEVDFLSFLIKSNYRKLLTLEIDRIEPKAIEVVEGSLKMFYQ
ncbi:TIM barrel protein [Oceanobacillus sp. FSL K6-0127]|uniref:sugar phosphate isomerase/epimerase family protein n=1 Tax=Oceanobacillus TaxID=182709 RepID=UPI0030EB8DCA